MIGPPANALHPGLGRFEVFDVARERLVTLGIHLACTSLPFSIHAPLTRTRLGEPATAVFFLANSPRRETSFTDLKTTLEAAARLHADYVVTHLNGTADAGSPRRAEALAYDAAARIVELSAASGVPVHIECGGYSGGFSRATQFAALASAFPQIRLCIDVGHIWLIAQERRRSAYREIEILAPWAGSMHLWAARGLATYRRRGHVPLHPTLTPDQGWLDLRRAIAPVLEARRDCAVIFEYSWAPEDRARAEEGLRWAEEVVRQVARGEPPVERRLL